MTILFDADDVAENLGECWVNALNERYGTSVRVEDLTEWDTTVAFPTLTRAEVYGILDEDGFWERLSPMPGSYEVLQRLRGEGHELYMVTASGYRSLGAKITRILNLFPFFDWEHVIVTSRKQLVRGDVLIDDGPHNLVGGEYAKLLFDRPHNQLFDAEANGIQRCRTWEEVERAIHAFGI